MISLKTSLTENYNRNNQNLLDCAMQVPTVFCVAIKGGGAPPIDIIFAADFYYEGPIGLDSFYLFISAVCIMSNRSTNSKNTLSMTTRVPRKSLSRFREDISGKI